MLQDEDVGSVDEFADDETVGVVEAALSQVGDHSPVEQWEWIRHGSANTVVLAGDVAVRVSRSKALAADAVRAQRLIDRLPELPFEVPRSLTEPVRRHGVIAVVQRRLRGEVHPPTPANPDAIRVLLEAIQSLPLEQLRADLAAPRSFMGGDAWYDVATTAAIPLLAADVQDEARRRIDALRDLKGTTDATVVHGDLAGANVLWAQGRVVGVLDWDLSSADDPAEDVASLAAWHGWDAVSESADLAVLARARVFAATHPIQVVCFAHLNRRSPADMERAVLRANERLRPRAD